MRRSPGSLPGGPRKGRVRPDVRLRYDVRMPTIPTPLTADEIANTPGMCGGRFPHALCPERAVETGIKGSLIGAAIGAFVGTRNRALAAVAGGALGYAASWYAASGRWWV